jgi:hypothetical protein
MTMTNMTGFDFQASQHKEPVFYKCSKYITVINDNIKGKYKKYRDVPMLEKHFYELEIEQKYTAVSRG